MASCSSLYSGYFNAYRHIASRDVLNGVIHLGDYLYDYVMPKSASGFPTPNRAPRRRLKAGETCTELSFGSTSVPHGSNTRLVIWDNHDLELAGGEALSGAIQAFTNTCDSAQQHKRARSHLPPRRLRRDARPDLARHHTPPRRTSGRRDPDAWSATRGLLDEVVDGSTAAWRLGLKADGRGQDQPLLWPLPRR